MARYTGTLEDFEKFVGPRMRNLVQKSISRRYKLEMGRCEECGIIEKLEAAHRHGRGRKILIRQALGENLVEETINSLDLSTFEARFIDCHQPPSDTFRILCPKCHWAYDNIKGEVSDIEETRLEEEEKFGKETLPMQFEPADPLEFKELLLTYRSSNITIFYEDREPEVKVWAGRRMTANSDIMHNLRSRKEFRQGEWQRNKITKVEISIND